MKQRLKTIPQSALQYKIISDKLFITTLLQVYNNIYNNVDIHMHKMSKYVCTCINRFKQRSLTKKKIYLFVFCEICRSQFTLPIVYFYRHLNGTTSSFIEIMIM